MSRTRVGWFARMCVVAVIAAAAAPRAIAAIESSGGLDADSAWAGGQVSFWMHIRNDQTVPLSNLRFQIVGTGVELMAICWPMRAGDAAPCSNDPVVDLPAESERLFTGRLRAVSAGAHRITLQGVDADGRVITIRLGSLSAANRAWSVVEWTKGLALPFVLGILGYAYQRRLQREQDARKNREELQAAARAKAEKALSERATSVRLMLPIVHQYAIRHYAELASASKQLAASGTAFAESVAAGAPDETALNDATFRLIKLHLNNREFYEHVGAMYFATLTGEDVATEAFSRLNEAVLRGQHQATKALTTILDALQQPDPPLVGQQTSHPSPAESPRPSLGRKRVMNLVKLEQFLESSSAETREAYDAIRNRLRSWLGAPGYENGLACATLYSMVLDHEMSLALEQWYGDAPTLRVPAACETICGEICEELDRTSRGSKARRYLNLRAAAGSAS
jgi:hypothetical protein